TPRRARTSNLRFRRPMLYPIELWVPNLLSTKTFWPHERFANPGLNVVRPDRRKVAQWGAGRLVRKEKYHALMTRRQPVSDSAPARPSGVICDLLAAELAIVDFSRRACERRCRVLLESRRFGRRC